MTPRSPIQKNQKLELEIEDVAFGGMGVSRVDGFVVFVKDSLPGDRVRARVVRRQTNHAQAELESILRPSALRIDPPCPLHAGCGGCIWQNLAYEEQLRIKERHVRETLAHIGAQADIMLEPILASPDPWRYRNKMEFTFGGEIGGGTILGYHRPGRFDQIFSVPACLIQPEPFDAVLNAAAEWARGSGLAPYNPRSHGGVLRSLTLRHSVSEDQWLAMLLTKTCEVGAQFGRLAQVLANAAPGFSGLLWGFNDGLADVARVDKEAEKTGQLWLEERLDEFVYRVSPLSFFQTNSKGAALLYRVAREYASLTGKETLLDAYCGAGAIGIFCARQARRVVGVEIVREAVWDARVNARLNRLDNCLFINAPMADGLRLAREAAGAHVDRVIIDPPRGGMDKRSLRQLLALRAPVFVYVSCNPATLARDVTTIVEAGYRVARARPVDLFPHTHHVETVVRFER